MSTHSNDLPPGIPGIHNLLPGKGRVLLASPFLYERPFDRSAVFLLDADRHRGHIGLILNKPMGMDMSRLVQDWPDGNRWPIYCGGPVDQSRLFMLHTLGDTFRGSQEIAPGIFVGGKLADISSYLQQEEVQEGALRFFMGYSGWEGGQLEEEISEGGWIVKRASSAESILTGQGAGYWRRELSEMGPSGMSLSMVPELQQLN